MFRLVEHPQDTQGLLYLHSMPGRHEEWSDFAAEARQHSIDVIVCLVPEDEIEKKSPSYAHAIRNGTLGPHRECFAVQDYAVPKDLESYADFVKRTAELLHSGDNVLVHCGAGIGRTGTFAICLLLALGVNLNEAQESIENARSGPETSDQLGLVSWCEEKLSSVTNLRSFTGAY